MVCHACCRVALARLPAPLWHQYGHHWQLLTVVQIIRAAAERGEATLFFCKIGKDRTGLMAALVLAACGATNDEIISDYNRLVV